MYDVTQNQKSAQVIFSITPQKSELRWWWYR